MSAGAPRTLHLRADGRLPDGALLASPGLDRVLGLLDRDGEEARLVGGAVRNALLGLPPGDLDIATTAVPEVVTARARAARLRVVPTGLAHGMVTILVAGSALEVTTLREDVETDGRHAVVRFGRDFASDALRRDFTINALSLSRDGRVRDVTGGVDDLAAGRVRFIGEPDRRIREDYLRVLRFFRFTATYGLGPIDAEGLAASIRHRDALTLLSRERIRSEMLKLLSASRAAEVVAAMDAAGLAATVLGRPCRPDRLGRLAALEQAEGTADPLLRLAALALDTAAAAASLRDALRLSNVEHQRLAVAAAARDRLDPFVAPGREMLRVLLYEFGPQAARDGVDLARTAAPGLDDTTWAEAAQRLRDEVQPTLPIGGADVLARGVGKGPRVGRVLKRLQADWIRAGFPADPAILGRLLEAAIEAEAASDLPAAN